MSEKKSAVPAAAAAPETPAAEPKKRKASDTAQRRDNVLTLRLIKQKAKSVEKYFTIVAVNCSGFSIE